MDSHRRSRRRRAAATAAVLGVVATAAFTGAGAAGAGAAGAQGGSSCRPYAPLTAHPFVKIVAQDDTFDTDCLKAPPDRAFRIYLQNQDRDTPHNLSIYSADPSSDTGAKQLYKGKPVKGRRQEEYAVDALPAGEYWFQDDNTPDMNGVVEIEPKKK